MKYTFRSMSIMVSVFLSRSVFLCHSLFNIYLTQKLTIQLSRAVAGRHTKKTCSNTKFNKDQASNNTAQHTLNVNVDRKQTTKTP